MPDLAGSAARNRGQAPFPSAATAPDPSASSAEVAYLFRHAVMRDAAYDIQLPSDRTRLHGLALALTEDLFGGRPPAGAPDEWGEARYDPHAADSLAVELARHARGSGQLEAESVWLRRAAEHAGGRQWYEEAANLWQQAAVLKTGSEQAECTRRAAESLLTAGNARLALPLLEQALRQSRETGDATRRTLALAALGRAYAQIGEVEKAQHAHQQVLEFHTRSCNQRGQGAALGNLAMLHYNAGRHTEALDLYRQALDFFKAAGAESQEATILGNVAAITEEAGHRAEAEEMYARALQVSRAQGNRRLEGVLLGNLAVVYARTGRIELAESTYNTSLAIHRETGNRRFGAIVLGNLGVRYDATGRHEAARLAFTESISTLVEIGSRLLEGQHRCNFTLCLVALGETQQAREQWQLGTAILGKIGDRAGLEALTGKMRQSCAEVGIEPFD